jgi:hypothetical protein
MISPSDEGAANDSIPAPGTEGREDECPAIYYSSALHWHLTHIWNLRIDNPTEDILQFCDNIHAAFHRVLYHPDAMVVFASVFEEFLIIPVGTIVGARNSPSFFCLLSELGSHLSFNGTFRDNDKLTNMTPLAQRIRLVPPLTPREESQIVPAVADSRHKGVPPLFQCWNYNSMFVDDNGLADLRARI